MIKYFITLAMIATLAAASPQNTEVFEGQELVLGDEEIMPTGRRLLALTNKTAGFKCRPAWVYDKENFWYEVLDPADGKRTDKKFQFSKKTNGYAINATVDVYHQLICQNEKALKDTSIGLTVLIVVLALGWLVTCVLYYYDTDLSKYCTCGFFGTKKTAVQPQQGGGGGVQGGHFEVEREPLVPGPYGYKFPQYLHML